MKSIIKLIKERRFKKKRLKRILEDQQKLTQFMIEINSGGIRSRETFEWWMNRY